MMASWVVLPEAADIAGESYHIACAVLGAVGRPELAGAQPSAGARQGALTDGLGG